MSTKDWIKQFLGRDGRCAPADGRPLYAYRVSDQEYDDLISVLKRENMWGIENLASSPMTKWSMVFVLFSAEWWRREYAGGAWSWEKIFERINAKRDELPVNIRNEAIQSGLQLWGREVRIGDHHREFLASIALEGGLPLCRLQSHGNGHGELLKFVIREFPDKQRFGFSCEDIARLHAHRLPVTFQRDEVYSVLGKIAETCIELRKDYGLSGQPDPVSWLNANVVNWEQKFPLNLSDSGADVLLKTLVEEAASLDESGATGIEIRRYLTHNSDQYQLMAELHLPEKKIEVESIQHLINQGDQKDLPARIKIYISVARKLQAAANLRLMAGTDCYRVRKQVTRFTGSDAADEIRLQLDDGMKGKVCEITLPGGSDLDQELPWVFTDTNENEPGNLLSQGRARIKDETCLVAVPTDLKIDQADGSCELIGALPEFNRNIFRIHDNVKLEFQAGPIWIKTNQIKTDIAEYEITGNFLEWKIQPKLTFRGSPTVSERNTDGIVRELSPQKLVWRWFGQGEDWRKSSPFPNAGVIELAGIDNESKELLFRRKVGILPNHTAIRLIPGNTVHDCEIEFSGLEQALIYFHDEKLEYQSKKEGNKTRLILKSKTGKPPTDISIAIQWPGKRADIKLELPFPAKGAHVFSGENRIVRKQTIYLNGLHGVHVRIFHQISWQSAKTRIIAYHTDDKSNIYFQRNNPAIENYGEIRLIEFEEEISRLFAASDRLDGNVVFKIEGDDGEKWTQLTIQQYQCRLSPNKTKGTVLIVDEAQKHLSLDDLQGMKVWAIPLAHPERNPVELEPICTEGAPTGEWRFCPEKRIAGTWLIYPSPDSKVKFRPIAWGNSLTSIDLVNNSLSSACLFPNETERFQVFDKQIRQMSGDPAHNGWSFLEKTLDSLGHLPLSSHDLFRRIVHNPDAMAGLFFLCNFGEFEKFAEELPFLWERVPYASWHTGLSLFVDKNRTKLNEDLILSIVRAKLDDLTSIVPSFEFGAGYILENYKGESSSSRNVESIALFKLFEDSDAEIQKMLRDASVARWPESFFERIPHWLNLMPSEYKRLVDVACRYCDTHEEKYRRSVVFLPILMGAEWVTGKRIMTPKPGESDQLFLYRVRQLQNFHRDWFDNAMKWTIGYGLSVRGE